jgi:hypothetical protein
MPPFSYAGFWTMHAMRLYRTLHGVIRNRTPHESDVTNLHILWLLI